MKHAILLAITMTLAACGNPTDSPKPVSSPRATGPRVVAACELVEEGIRVRLYLGDDELTRDVAAFNCVKGGKQYVEFRWNAGWSGGTYKYEHLSEWVAGRELPEYLDANINCQIQECEKE